MTTPRVNAAAFGSLPSCGGINTEFNLGEALAGDLAGIL
jgi:hypothetical protein